MDLLSLLLFLFYKKQKKYGPLFHYFQYKLQYKGPQVKFLLNRACAKDRLGKLAS